MTTMDGMPLPRLRLVGVEDDRADQADGGVTGGPLLTEDRPGAGPEVPDWVEGRGPGRAADRADRADRSGEGGPGRVVLPSGLDRSGAALTPVVPEWLRTAEQRAALVRHLWARARHAAAFHTLRLPKYGGRVAVRAPVGAVRALHKGIRFVSDAEGRPLRHEAVTAVESAIYLKLVRERNNRVRVRLIGTGLLALLLLVAVLAAWLRDVPAPAWWAGALVLVTALAVYGSPEGRPLVESSVTTFSVPRLTHPMIEAALGALGIGLLSSALRSGQGVAFPSDVARDGAGYRAEVDLPLGVTAGDVLDKRERLASALRRPLGTVWPEGDPDVHEGRLVLWVADRDLAKAGRIPFWLERSGTHDVFKPVQLGLDPRGRPVLMPLMFNNVLVGAMPRQGKTAAVRTMACAAALDPTVELWIHELKGTGDFAGLEQTSHRYMSGIDDEAVAYTADSIAQLREEVKARGARLKALPQDVVPDRKVTRQVASRRSLRLHPIVCIVDEAQNLFADKTVGKQAAEDAEYLIKIGPALGIVLILATQRPDKESLPTGVSGNVSQRLCFHVAGQVENDMILGTSAYKNGHRATTFRPEIEAGIGIQRGARSKPTVVRCAYVDGPATARIGARARALRESLGLLTGHAIGQTDEPVRERVDVGRDVLSVFAAGESALWNETILARLGDGVRPGYYDGWSSAQLTAALKAAGIDVVKGVFRDRTNKRGIHVRDLRAALDLEED